MEAAGSWWLTADRGPLTPPGGDPCPWGAGWCWSWALLAPRCLCLGSARCRTGLVWGTLCRGGLGGCAQLPALKAGVDQQHLGLGAAWGQLSWCGVS